MGNDDVSKISTTTELINNNTQGWKNFFLSAAIFRACKFSCAPDWVRKKKVAQTQSTSPIETQPEAMFLVLYYLALTAFIFNLFP